MLFEYILKNDIYLINIISKEQRTNKHHKSCEHHFSLFNIWYYAIYKNILYLHKTKVEKLLYIDWSNISISDFIKNTDLLFFILLSIINIFNFFNFSNIN